MLRKAVEVKISTRSIQEALMTKNQTAEGATLDHPTIAITKGNQPLDLLSVRGTIAIFKTQASFQLHLDFILI